MKDNYIKISIDLPESIVKLIDKAAIQSGKKRNPKLREVLVKYLPLMLIDSDELNTDLKRMIEKSVKKNMDHFTSRIAKLSIINLAETQANIEHLKSFLKPIRNEELEDVESESLKKWFEEYEKFIERIEVYNKKGE